MAKLQLFKKKKTVVKQVHQADTMPKTSIFGELKLVNWATPKQLFWLLIYTVLLCGIISAVMMGLDNFFGVLRDSIIK